MIWQNLFYGFILGIGFIIPGVSGGVIATILGIYEEIINRITNFFQDINQNSKYLLPLIMGIFISILLFSKIIVYLLNNKLDFISYVFIGLILGSIPFLYQEVRHKCHKSLIWQVTISTFIFGIILFIIQRKFINIDYNPSIYKLILAGLFYSIGKIVPGISGASLLMLIGVYNYFLNIIANLKYINITLFIKLIPFIFSFLISSLLLLKLLNYLLTKHFRFTYSAIIGFVISSILFIFPNTFTPKSILITSLSFLISYNLMQKNKDF